MSITKLDFAAPFFDVEYIEDEKSVNVGSKSIVINIAPKGDAINISMGTRLSPMRSAIVVNTSLYNIDRALIVKDYTRYDISNPLTREQTKRHWLSLWEFSHLERDRTVPYWKTPQAKVGGDTTMNFCFASEGTANGSALLARRSM